MEALSNASFLCLPLIQSPVEDLESGMAFSKSLFKCRDVITHCTGEWCPGKDAEGVGRTEWREGLVLREAASVVVNLNCQLDGFWNHLGDGLLGMSGGGLS